MKKTIAILLVLVIGMVGVWAAFTDTTTQNLVLSTDVAINNAFKITTTDLSTSTFYAVFGVSGESTPANATRTVDIEDSEDGLTEAAWLTIGTNDPAGFTMYLQSATKLAKDSDNTNSKIDYTISVGSATWNTASAPTSGVSVGTVTTTNSAIVESKQIKVVIDPVSYYNAEATTSAEDYTANVVFHVSAS